MSLFLCPRTSAGPECDDECLLCLVGSDVEGNKGVNRRNCFFPSLLGMERSNESKSSFIRLDAWIDVSHSDLLSFCCFVVL